jgi:hypothetical protein
MINTPNRKPIPRKPPVKRAFSGLVGLPPEPETEKPAQTAAPVLEVTHAKPMRAGATGVRRSSIDPGVRKQIESSLSVAPAYVPAKVRVSVETSEGLKTVPTKEDIKPTDITDDASSGIDRGEKKFTGLPAAPRKETSKQPAYLKSVAHRVVPSADPEAPYGRDENNKPIHAARTDQEIATDLLTKDFLKPGLCPHNCDPNDCLLCGTRVCTHKRIPHVGKNELQILADGLNKHLNESKKKFESNIQKAAFTSYVDVLGIDRADLIQLLDLPAGTKPRLTEEKILKDHSTLDARILELKAQIEESERLIKSWSASAMKLLRPEDILDKSTREKFKRDERKKIAEAEQDIHDLRVRLKEWADNPANYDSILKTVYVVQSLRARIDLRMLEEHDIKQFEDEKEVVSVDKYLDILSNGLLFPDRRTWRKWEEFENEIVIEAIRWGLIKFEKDLPQNTTAEYQPEDTVAQDNAEIALIVKTGGSQIGASIYGGGTTWSGKPRASGNFDKTLEFGNKDKGQSGSGAGGEFFAEIDSSDFGEGSED